MKKIWGKDVCENLEEVLQPDGCAVLIIDMQNDAIRPEGKFAKAGNNVSPMLEILPRCAAFIQGARSFGVPVIHIRVATLPEGRSDSASWLRAKGGIVGETEYCLEGTWGAEICEEVAPVPGEIVITKYRSSAFVGTNLDQVLRTNGVQTLVIIGEQTPGCIEATYRDAAYHDYYNVIVEDCVAAYDLELHEASLKIQRARHDVCTATEALAIWSSVRQLQFSRVR